MSSRAGRDPQVNPWFYWTGLYVTVQSKEEKSQDSLARTQMCINRDTRPLSLRSYSVTFLNADLCDKPPMKRLTPPPEGYEAEHATKTYCFTLVSLK